MIATKQTIDLDDIPKHLRDWKTEHFHDCKSVLILVDPYEALTQKQLKNLFSLRAELNHAAFLVFSKLTAANAIPPRTQLVHNKGETDMPERCLRQHFLDSQNLYTLYSFGVGKGMWRDSITAAFGGKGTVALFRDVGLAFFERRVAELQTQLLDPQYRQVTKANWEREIKQITETVLKPLSSSSFSVSSAVSSSSATSSASLETQEDVLCVCEFFPESPNLALPLCLYSVLFEDRRKVFDINRLTNKVRQPDQTPPPQQTTNDKPKMRKKTDKKEKKRQAKHANKSETKTQSNANAKANVQTTTIADEDTLFQLARMAALNSSSSSPSPCSSSPSSSSSPFDSASPFPSLPSPQKRALSSNSSKGKKRRKKQID